MIKETDVDDVRRLVARDRDVATFIMELSQMLERYGAFITTRIFALVLGPYKRRRFERMLLVQELNASSPMKPDSLSNASGDVFEQIGAAFDHVTFWQDRGDLRYLTAEPSSVRKDTLKRVIALCDRHDIDFQIDAESCFAPGQTIRLLFKRGTITPYDATAHLAGERPSNWS